MELNNTAASVLGFLGIGPMSGWDVYRLAEETIGNFWSISRSQVHRELTALEAAGLVEGRDEGPRGRRVFSLTPNGRQALKTWLDERPGPETIRIPFLIKLFFADHMEPDRLARLLRQERDRHEERAEYYQKKLASDVDRTPFWEAALRFGIAYETAVLQWFEELSWDDGRNRLP